jgi:hypothetical protein
MTDFMVWRGLTMVTKFTVWCGQNRGARYATCVSSDKAGMTICVVCTQVLQTMCLLDRSSYNLC